MCIIFFCGYYKLKICKTKAIIISLFSILYEIFSIVCKTERPHALTDRPIENIELAVEYISEHLASENIKTAKLAQLCGISEKYFRTLFKRRFGVTPTQYIIELRLQTAVKFLGYGGFTVAEIADMVGIPDVYYFSKLFKKTFGVSPSKFHGNLKTE
ncbi:MAG: helix-turn-helix transcriptional regulator [Clostridia bacterium]|nr:helix-turn-helix transcriptional regulator [Clostridia bacterium]